MIDWIQGEKFQDISDWRYAPSIRYKDDYNHLVNDLDFRKLNEGDVIYTHTFYAKQLFDILDVIGKPVYIITHNADEPADWIPPDCVIHWWSQNVGLNHPKIESIPIGLENNRWWKGLRKRAKMEEMIKGTLSHNKLIYMNHNIKNNRAQRQRPYELFGKSPWMTVHHGKNGLRFDEYLINVSNHKFMICPEGSGIDCHRFWECLYLGTIPVVKKCINVMFYKHLPVLIINDWDELSEDFLWNYYNTVKHDWSKIQHQLTFGYWKDKILKECGRK